MLRPLLRLSLAFALAFLALGLLLGYWAIVRASDLTPRLDNPRRLIREQNWPRGQITDRNGKPLAASLGTRGDYRRIYPAPEAAPVVGYDSLLYGQSGIEAALDDVLSGQAGRDATSAWWQDLLYGGPTSGFNVSLTLDGDLQAQAMKALAGMQGAVVVLDPSNGDILALASSPSFDPSTLDDDWPALSTDPASPLLNRATQGQYLPGGILQPVLLAAALQSGSEFSQATGETSTCADTSAAELLTLRDAFTFSCPGPFADLGQSLGPTAVLSAFDQFQLTAPVLLPQVFTVSPPPLALADMDAALEATGEGTLTVSPLRMALITAAIANGGLMPAPRLVDQLQTANGARVAPPLGLPVTVLSPQLAAQIADLMARLSQTAIGAKVGSSIAGHFAIAQTGEANGNVAWFTGFTPFNSTHLVIAVALEDATPEQATSIGVLLLRAATQ